MKVKMDLCVYIKDDKQYSYMYIINEDRTLFKTTVDQEWMKCESYDDIVSFFKLKSTKDLN
jgi:hypothetical protein